MDYRADIQSSVFLIIDMQDRLLKAIDQSEKVLEETIKLTKCSKEIGVKILATEQYRKGLGLTNDSLREELEEEWIFEKTTFSAFDTEGFVKQLEQLSIKTLVIAGVEAHICVLQTALAGIERGYDVRVVADAVSSRTAFNKEIGLNRLRAAGVKIDSFESILYEWIKEAGTPEFKAILPLVK